MSSTNASESINKLIIQNKNITDISQQAKKEGMKTLRNAALNKITQGITNIEEINRVI